MLGVIWQFSFLGCVAVVVAVVAVAAVVVIVVAAVALAVSIGSPIIKAAVH